MRLEQLEGYCHAIKKHIEKESGKGRSNYIDQPELHCSELHALLLLVDHIESEARNDKT